MRHGKKRWQEKVWERNEESRSQMKKGERCGARIKIRKEEKESK